MALNARLATEDPADVSSAIHRGSRRSVTRQAVPYRLLQPEVGEKSGPIGGVGEDEIWVELNPQYRDNNLQLRGTLDDNRYAGEWMWISFVGITNQGTFEALRR